MQTKITLIGCGRWGLNILRDLKLLNCCVTAIDINPSALEKALQIGASNAYQNINDYLTHSAPTQGYIIAANTQQHYSILLQLRDYTKPIFVEKPMVLDLKQAQYIQSIMGSRIFVMHKWRYHPGINKLKLIIQNKQLGNVEKISTIRHGLNHEYDIPGYLILLPHDLSIILELLDDIPDIQTITPYQSQNKLTGFKIKFKHNPHIHIDVCSSNKIFHREVKVTFKQGFAIFSEKNYNSISVFDKNEQWKEDIILSQEEPLYKELQTFLNHLKDNSPLKSDINDELKIAQCTEKLMNSIKTNYSYLAM